MHLPPDIGTEQIFIVLAALITLMNARIVMASLMSAVDSIRRPPPPSHPLPGNDSAFLTRRRSRIIELIGRRSRGRGSRWRLR
jgi:hypothetical protein